MSVKEAKHNIAIFFRKHHFTGSYLYKVLIYVNEILFHGDDVLTRKNYGRKNKEIVFYVIRNNSREGGLIALYFDILIEIDYALKHGYVPFVDLQNSGTQYTTGELIQGSRNAWEYFWEQPSKYEIDEIYESRNVILSGRNRQVDREKCNGEMYRLCRKYDFYNSEDTHKLYEFIKKNTPIKPYIYERVERIWNEHFGNGKVIGLFIRGTDYTAFQPKGHPIQPTKECLYEKFVELHEKHPLDKVFLVTEDEKIYAFFKDKLQGMLIEIDDIRFSQYEGDDYLYKYCKGNTYQIGLCYLTKLLLLSKCNYLIASQTNGSELANIMNDNCYEERIILDLGVYE